MKNVLTNIAAILLVIWYSLSVIGFDVHTCSGSGQTYIATVASGFSCEDIHPDHAHSGCGCCHGEGASDDSCRLDRKPCCSDEYHVIMLTGVRGDDSDDSFFKIQGGCLCQNITPDTGSYIYHSGLNTFKASLPGDFVPRCVRVSYNIWRI